MRLSVKAAVVFLLLSLSSLAIIPFCECSVVDNNNEATAASSQKQQQQQQQQYLIVGVSGGLQDGFPEHSKLDYRSGEKVGEESKAIFLGRALVRGYKAYLDVMQEGWRQYMYEPDQPLINSNVFASGCYEHANEYWIYIVDSRQVMNVLNNEPRFLSITPDTGMLDLEAEETHKSVCDFMRNEITTKKQHKSITDIRRVAIPLVTAVWFQEESHVPSPPIRIHQDGTEVTNFPDSLAKWANVSDADRTAIIDDQCSSSSSSSSSSDNKDSTELCLDKARKATQRYWDGIRKAIRAAEANRPSTTTGEEIESYGPPYKCKRKVRFGVGNDTARVNYHFTQHEITKSLKEIGYTVDYEKGEMYEMMSEERTDEL